GRGAWRKNHPRRMRGALIWSRIPCSLKYFYARLKPCRDCKVTWPRKHLNLVSEHLNESGENWLTVLWLHETKIKKTVTSTYWRREGWLKHQVRHSHHHLRRLGQDLCCFFAKRTGQLHLIYKTKKKTCCCQILDGTIFLFMHSVVATWVEWPFHSPDLSPPKTCAKC
uniref:Uncharacterized protein n=1 Tax=Oryzias latipes TaxID=8090 RepID=A0A3B3IK66_ORYLA